ncbi:GH116 family glycosyl hydrolase [Maribacter sp. 2304DJ31-5]|uniref:GH116 family glycosyl hydrolase n=1 Tax=Maribacter sp. 2304DJ31-5 TaxID=3386273 RepID=UPI0039BCDA2B
MKKIGLLFLLWGHCMFSQSTQTEDLKYIGMPVNGICTGQIYLGGDGQLWNWDIFNVSMLDPGSEPGFRYYVNPMVQGDKPFENGFGITIKDGFREFYRPLNKNGFSDIEFNGEYPVGNVQYKDVSCPVTVDLKAYSPFIPTDADNSGLPVTVLEYTVTNTQEDELEIELGGWLQNMSGYLTGKGKKGKHLNRIETTDKYTRLVSEGEGEYENELADWGNMSLTLLGEGKASAKLTKYKGIDIYLSGNEVKESSEDLGNTLVGGVYGGTKLKKGERKTFTFLISWYFPNVHLWDAAHDWKDKEDLRHYYDAKFDSASEVSDYVIDNPWLLDATKNWKDSWYDSSLPKWFLDRTFVNVSTLATSACQRFHDITGNPENEGRFYTFEGVYKGPGTCTHVFHYEQALGRVFPDLAMQLREQTDLGLSYKKDGVIGYRGEFSDIGKHDGRGYAVDGHAGTIMRIYREHQMSSDRTFLKNNWGKIKKSIRYMINHDKEKTGKADGILEGVQYNTLDRVWYGKITWISGLYAAALKAGSEMAKEMGDKRFARECSKIASLAFKNISQELYNGEYFTHERDPDHLDTPNTNIGCHTDQLLGQYWSTQVGLGDILPKEQVQSALKSIVKYNYVENYGDYLANAEIPIKRWYADYDEPGIIMCTFPKGGGDQAPGEIKNEWEKTIVGYFSEIWTGQEHQLAAALLSEGMVEEALKVEKAVHMRYSAERRNPYNEIEYGNHYTRAMSGYAPFVSASGFYYHGPKGIVGFDPKMDAQDFSSAFITGEGWGSFTQKITGSKQINSLTLTYGKLRVGELRLAMPSTEIPKTITATINGKVVGTKFKIKDKKTVAISFKDLNLKKGDNLEITIGG